MEAIPPFAGQGSAPGARARRLGWRWPMLAVLVVLASSAALAAAHAPLTRLLAGSAVALGLVAAWIDGRREHRLHALADRAGALASGGEASDPLDRIEGAVDALAGLVGSINHRFTHRHKVTGLATREPLFAAIAADAAARHEGGVLGVVEFTDFDRLNAFDSALAEKMLAVVAERVVRMVGRRRIVAHVDRARIAIWFGAGSIDTARAELDAIGYALADGVAEADGLQPQVRIGCATFPSDGDTPPALLTRAIAHAASTGGEADSADRQEAARASFGLEQDLRQAVARNQLALAFQPLVDAAARRVCGAEALLRWAHPERGAVSPGEFVPIMEAAGLSEEFGLWVMNAACRQIRDWQRQRLDGLRVAINVSALQLAREDLATLVERTLARHRLPGAALEIELTETVAAADASGANAFFEAVRRLGVAVAIDDFGTGFSSLSTLRKLAFDKLKIDREFVTEVDRRPDSQAICQSVIALGRGLGIRVLAEGVERPEEYRWLRRHGCTLFQGYYFAPPLAPEAFRAFVRDRAGLEAQLSVTPQALQQDIENRIRA